MLSIRPFRSEDEPAVVELWHRCDLVRPQNDPHRDIERKLKVRPDLFLVAELDRQIVGTVMAGYEGHRGWLNYVAVAPSRRRQGIGRKLMAEAERRLRREGCPKINLLVRTSNLPVVDFYKSLGYASDEANSFGKRLEDDTVGARAASLVSVADAESVVQRQLDAFNARDVEGIAATYAFDARQFEYPDKLLAVGLVELRARWTERFREPNLQARLLNRIVVGNTVIDHEEVTRTFPEGPGRIELVGIYTVENAKITSATFRFGTKVLDQC